MVLYDDKTFRSLKVLVLGSKYESCRSVGQELLVYNVSYLVASQYVVNKTIGILTLPALFYELYWAPGDPWLLISSPYLKRQLCTLKLQDNFTEATLMDKALSGHHVRLVRIFTDQRWIVTCAYDGLVVIRDRVIQQIVAVVPVHHRLDLGSQKAIVKLDGDIVVALGHDGSLIATRVYHENEKVCINYNRVIS